MIEVQQRKLSYTTYLSFRSEGCSPSTIQDKWARMRDRMPGMTVEGLVSIVVGIIAYVVVDNLVKSFPLPIFGWVTSPTKQTIAELPYSMAKRLSRKHGWVFSSSRPSVSLWKRLFKHSVVRYWGLK